MIQSTQFVKTTVSYEQLGMVKNAFQNPYEMNLQVT